MENYYRRQALSTAKPLFPLALCLVLIWSGVSAQACNDELPEPEVASTTVNLKAYSAQYKTSARGLNLTLNRELTLTDAGQYTLTNGGSALIAGFEEESLFRVEGTRIIPKSYVYQGTGLMNRRREVQFTEGAKTLRSLYKEKWYELPYNGNLLDRMSQQEQLRLLLLNNPTPEEDVIITVVDGKRVKDYTLRFVAREMLRTALGEVETLHFERDHHKADRKSDTWVAPQWDYLMVKTVHLEDGKKVEAVIKTATMDGTSLGMTP